MTFVSIRAQLTPPLGDLAECITPSHGRQHPVLAFRVVPLKGRIPLCLLPSFLLPLPLSLSCPTLSHSLPLPIRLLFTLSFILPSLPNKIPHVSYVCMMCLSLNRLCIGSSPARSLLRRIITAFVLLLESFTFMIALSA